MLSPDKFKTIHDNLTVNLEIVSGRSALAEAANLTLDNSRVKKKKKVFTWNMSGVVAEEKLRLLPMWVSGSYFDM